MAAPQPGSFSHRAALGAFSTAHRVVMAAPPRVHFAVLYLLLGALWLANASTIARSFERCTGVDCFHLDDECRISLQFSSIGLGSMMMLWAHCRKLSEAREVSIQLF
jgi:hypothetical protein